MTARLDPEPQADDAAARGAPVLPSLARGTAVIRGKLKTLPSSPGVYRFVDKNGDVLYVGKARQLRHRVGSYAQVSRLTARLQRMVAQVADLEVITTHTEVEALLLESNLIKRYRPPFNVSLRDDKSFPYILVTGDHDWPEIVKYRGPRTRPGEYFGPFASAGAVNRTLNALERAFLLRSCSDAVFASRTRPCLKYQLKRCSAPCVARIAPADYADLVGEATAFLAGRSQEVSQRLAAAMQAASDAMEFESAARYRDRIRALAQIQAHQDVSLEAAGFEDADVIAAHREEGQICVQVFFFRGGRNNGNRAYFPRHDRSAAVPDVLAAFVGQFYDNKPPPKLVLLSHAVPEQALIAEALSVSAERKVRVTRPQRGAKRQVVARARDNARDALARRLAESASHRDLLDRLAEVFALDGPPRRVEVYDNSHIVGTNAIGAMIVVGPDGPMKQAYRKFNIKGAVTPGDDYAMMREVLTRRFSRAIKEDPDRDRGQWPDAVLIDGGQGQLNVAEEVFAELGVDDVALIAIAKGPDRDAGRERFFLTGRTSFRLPEQDPLLYFLQRLRDEAHRFAIGTHRARRSKAIGTSPLDEIAGVGARRKKALLLRFGSARAVARAGLKDLEAVDGISASVARAVYDHFHGER